MREDNKEKMANDLQRLVKSYDLKQEDVNYSYIR